MRPVDEYRWPSSDDVGSSSQAANVKAASRFVVSIRGTLSPILLSDGTGAMSRQPEAPHRAMLVLAERNSRRDYRSVLTPAATAI